MFFPTHYVKRFGLALEDASGGWLLIAIAAAPWMYGSTRHWAIIRLCELLTLMAGYWLAGLLVQKRSPRLPRKVLWPALFLLASGWLITLAGPKMTSEPFTASHFARLYARWPGSFIIKTPVETMWLFSGLLAALLVTVDLSAERQWQTAFYSGMAIVGASIVILGIVQIKTGAHAILWNEEVQNTDFFFATFFHHSSAGAFINLVWPLSAALIIMRLSQVSNGLLSGRIEMFFWISVLLITFCGLAAQVSRFAQANGFILLLLCFSWLLWRSSQKSHRLAISSVVSASLLVCIIGFVTVKSGKYAQIAERWQLLLPPNQVAQASPPTPNGFVMHANMFLESTDPKAHHFLGIQRLVAGTCARIIAQGGLLGFGPGSWSSIYAHFTNDALLRTFYLHMQFAHEDYLQTMVEWGMLGAGAWGLLIFGGLHSGWRQLYLSGLKLHEITREEAIAVGSAISLCGVLLHATIDFPLQIPAIQLYVCVLIGLLWSGRLRMSSASREQE